MAPAPVGVPRCGLPAARGSITTRAISWAIRQLRAEHATIGGLARQLRVAWWTLWRVVKPRLEDLAADESRFAGVGTLGVDEHVWHHTPHKTSTKGPAMFTGMVDLTRDQDGRVHARLLDLVPGRTGKAYATWLTDRTAAFRSGVKVATLDPYRGYANALRDELSEAVPVLDAFHVVKLAAQAMDEIRRRVQQDTLGHRGRAGDPLYRIRNILHRAAGELTERQWKDTYLGYFTTGGANNGGTEAINGIIELHRRIARGYRNPDNYRLRMLLVADGLLLPPDLR